jgi:DeoR/GlpR family transcriptional regulator of sugar metabolism
LISVAVGDVPTFKERTVLAAMRQARILEEVRRTGGARVAHLTALLGVSDMTVRRDLEMLDRKGLLS